MNRRSFVKNIGLLIAAVPMVSAGSQCGGKPAPKEPPPPRREIDPKTGRERGIIYKVTWTDKHGRVQHQTYATKDAAWKAAISLERHGAKNILIDRVGDIA